MYATWICVAIAVAALLDAHVAVGQKQSAQKHAKLSQRPARHSKPKVIFPFTGEGNKKKEGWKPDESYLLRGMRNKLKKQEQKFHSKHDAGSDSRIKRNINSKFSEADMMLFLQENVLPESINQPLEEHEVSKTFDFLLSADKTSQHSAPSVRKRRDIPDDISQGYGGIPDQRAYSGYPDNYGPPPEEPMGGYREPPYYGWRRRRRWGPWNWRRPWNLPPPPIDGPPPPETMDIPPPPPPPPAFGGGYNYDSRDGYGYEDRDRYYGWRRPRWTPRYWRRNFDFRNRDYYQNPPYPEPPPEINGSAIDSEYADMYNYGPRGWRDRRFRRRQPLRYHPGEAAPSRNNTIQEPAPRDDYRNEGGYYPQRRWGYRPRRPFWGGDGEYDGGGEYENNYYGGYRRPGYRPYFWRRRNWFNRGGYGGRRFPPRGPLLLADPRTVNENYATDKNALANQSPAQFPIVTEHSTEQGEQNSTQLASQQETETTAESITTDSTTYSPLT